MTKSSYFRSQGGRTKHFSRAVHKLVMASSGEGAATTSAADACATGDINVGEAVVAEEVGAAVVAPSSEPNASGAPSDEDSTPTLAVPEKQGAQKPQAPVRPSSPTSPRSSAEGEGGAVATADGKRAQIDTTSTYIHHHHHHHQHPALLHTFPYSHQCNTQDDPQHDPQPNQPLPCPPHTKQHWGYLGLICGGHQGSSIEPGRLAFLIGK